MRQRAILITIAVLLGLVAAVMVTNYANQAREAAVSRAKPVKILVAKAPLPLGATLQELLDRELVEAKNVPKEFVAEGALGPTANLGDRVLTSDVGPGEQLTESKFKISKEAGLAYTVPEDKVAVAIPIDDMKAAGNLVKIGDYVNVVGTAKLTGSDNKYLTKTILHKVRVLALGQSLENQEKGKATPVSTLSSSGTQQMSRTVTLALSQADAEKLIFMQDQGRVWLTVLPSKEAKAVTTKGQTIDSVFEE